MCRDYINLIVSFFKTRQQESYRVATNKEQKAPHVKGKKGKKKQDLDELKKEVEFVSVFFGGKIHIFTKY